MKQTISSRFSSSCNVWKIRNTTVRSSAFFPWWIGFHHLLGTEQPLWCKKLFSETQPGLHMPEALLHEPHTLPSKVSQARSGLCSLQLNLPQRDWVCIHPDPAPSCSPKTLQRCSPRARSWIVTRPLGRAQCSGTCMDLGYSLSLPVLWEMQAEAKEHSQFQHAP